MRARTIAIAIAGALGSLLPFVAPVAAQAPQPTYQVQFVGPAPGGMRVDYQVDRQGRFSQRPLVTPARLDFSQPAVFRLKLTHIPGHEGVTLYPTLEIAPATPRSEAFLAHNAVVVEFTERDIAQAVAGKFVTKVIHLPEDDREFVPGGARRGTALAIVRLGNRQLEEP